jgi:hypothetical protein
LRVLENGVLKKILRPTKKEVRGDDYRVSTYLLTPWCWIIFEKIFVNQFVKNIPLSYGTRRFTTVFTNARHWTLS